MRMSAQQRVRTLTWTSIPSSVQSAFRRLSRCLCSRLYYRAIRRSEIHSNKSRFGTIGRSEPINLQIARLCQRIPHLQFLCAFRTCNFCVHFAWSQALLFHRLVGKNNCRLFSPPPALPFRENIRRFRCFLASPRANKQQNKTAIQSLTQPPPQL